MASLTSSESQSSAATSWPARAAPGPVDPAVQRDNLGDRIARTADDDLFAVLDPLDDPRQVGLRVMDVELRSGLAAWTLLS